MRGDGGVAGEGRVVGVPKFHKYHSDWMSNASSGLCIIYTQIGTVQTAIRNTHTFDPTTTGPSTVRLCRT